MQDHPGGGGGVQGADGLLCGLLLHSWREADQRPALQVAHTISLYTYLLNIFYTILRLCLMFPLLMGGISVIYHHNLR